VNEADLVSVAWIAGRGVDLDPEELQGALRRALLLLAAGGDPRREPELDGRAVTSLAAELDRPERRAELAAALRELRNATAELLTDPDLAWRAFSCALIAEELAGE
jgi:hypothetical protein